MRRKVVLLAGLGLLFAGCGPAGPGKQSSATPPVAGKTAPASPSANALDAEDLDPFILAIDSERRHLLIEHAIDGVRRAPEPTAATTKTNAQTTQASYALNKSEDLKRADSALKEAGLALVRLRNDACEKAAATGVSCDLGAFPGWVTEAPGVATDPRVLLERSQWLDEKSDKLVKLGCELGRKHSREEMFCSVE